jgi:predicted ribosome quality control (RQC) complex YloA/Tae2 family protein
VDYTLRKNVRRLKGGKRGQVVYMGQKTLGVQPRGPAELG